ncbi:hypothetical protein ACS0TY_001655 [Phlomoides rotata]
MRKQRTEDRISELPDDILISIISRLALHEAIATSILSTRWRHLYAYITRLNLLPSLKQRKGFKPLAHLCRGGIDDLDEVEKMKRYFMMAYDFFKSHKHHIQVIKEFRMRMPIPMTYSEGAFNSNIISMWLDLVSAQEVEIMDIHLNSHGHPFVQNLNPMYSGFNCLKKLTLTSYVSYNGAILLPDSPLLESLSIHHCQSLRYMSVFGHPSLKHLDISYCSNIQSISLCDMINFVSLVCFQLSKSFFLQLKNLPKLTPSTTSGKSLEQVVLRIPPRLLDKLNSPSHQWGNRRLEFQVSSKVEREIELWWGEGPYKMKFLETTTAKSQLMKFLETTTAKSQLKVSGYLGSPSEAELVRFMMDNLRISTVQYNSV